MPPKSIWRSDKAQHFALVHRSQQDPLAYDAESSSRVLKPTTRKNQQRRGQTREELEEELGDYSKKQRSNVGEAAQYGIFYDDTEYDYMQHLRAVGDDYHRRRGGVDEENDAEVIMLEAPKTAQSRGKGKGKEEKQQTDIVLKEDQANAKEGKKVQIQLPPEALPSERMMPRNFDEQVEKGLRPDLDPHLRQVLEALEDDAFLMRTAKGGKAKEGDEVEESLDIAEEEDEPIDLGDDAEDIDDFFGDIVKDGELDTADEEPEWRMLPPEGEESIWEDQGSKAAKELLQLKQHGGGIDDLSLESRVALFKKAQLEEQERKVAEAGSKPKQAPSSVGSQSIFGEKGPSRKTRHAGAKARLAASYYAPSADGGSTAFSMSSSAMERNHGLTGLDEQFDRMEKIYEDEDDDEDEEVEEGEGDDITPANVDAIFEDFLNNNEIVGNKLRQRLGDRETTSSEKVDILRREIGEVRLIDKLSIDEADDDREHYDEVIRRDLQDRERVRNEWDVETVLTTKTNVENHPRTIASTTSHLPRSIAAAAALNGGTVGSNGTSNRMAKIRINPRTGVPQVAGYVELDGSASRRRHGQQQQDSPCLNGDTTERIAEEGEDDSDAESDVSSNATELASQPQYVTVTRDRNESKEDKKARKQAVKEQRRAVRQSKAARKQTFEAEMSKQRRIHGDGSGTKQPAALKLS